MSDQQVLRTSNGNGNGKVILFGEHSVVFGNPAIAAGLSLHASATAELDASLDAPTLFLPSLSAVVSCNAERCIGDHSLEVLPAFLALCEHFDLRKRGVRIDVSLDIPIGAGLGSSAALGVAIAGALGRIAAEKSISSGELIAAANKWEQVFHGNASGIDVTLAALGGLKRFVRGETATSLSLRRPLHLVVAHTGESSGTKKMVESVARQQAAQPEKVAKLFAGIAAVTRAAEGEMQNGNWDALGQLMELNHTLLSALMLSTDSIESLRSMAKDFGALGSKLTGGGGGGCVLILMRDEKAMRAMEKNFRSKNVWAHSEIVFSDRSPNGPA